MAASGGAAQGAGGPTDAAPAGGLLLPPLASAPPPSRKEDSAVWAQDTELGPAGEAAAVSRTQRLRLVHLTSRGVERLFRHPSLSLLFEDTFLELKSRRLSRALFTEEQLQAHEVLSPYEAMHVEALRAKRLSDKLTDLRTHRALEARKLKVLRLSFRWMKRRARSRRRARYILLMWHIKVKRHWQLAGMRAFGSNATRRQSAEMIQCAWRGARARQVSMMASFSCWLPVACTA